MLLLDNQRHVDRYEVPETVSQAGIARELGLRQNHVSRAISELESGGLVFSRSSHIVAQPRRKKVYFLTSKGVEDTKAFVQGLGPRTVLVHTPEGELREMRFEMVLALLERLGPQAPTCHGFFQEFPDASEIDLRPARHGKKAPPGPPGPGNAPKTRQFFGRVAEASEMDRSLADEGVRFVCVLSIAGQGKTSFLANYITRLKGRPVHWSNVYEWTAPPNLLNDWSMFFKELGRQELFDCLGTGTSGLQDALGALLRDCSGSRAVLVIDDFHKASKDLVQMFTMLRSMAGKDGPVFIVSGRNRPGFYKASDLLVSGRFKELELGGLDRESSRKILASRGIPEMESERAFAITKGHPLALELYRPQVLSNGGDAVRDFNTFLSEEVARELGPQENEVMKLSSLFEQPVQASAFMFKQGTDQGLIDGLCRKMLLKRHMNDTFSTHDLIRNYFLQRMSPGERDALLSVAIDYYSNRGADNDQLEYLRLLSGSIDRKRFAQAVLESGEYLLGQGYAQVGGYIEDLSEEELTPMERIALLVLRADNALLRRRPAQAKVHLERALAQCNEVLRSRQGRAERSELVPMISKIYSLSAEISRFEGKLEDILKAHRESLRLNKEYGNGQGIGKSLNNLGMAYLERGELDQSLRQLEQACDKFKELGDLASMALVELNIAQVHLKRMDHKRAGQHLETAREHLPQRSPVLGLAYKRLGRAYLEMGQYRAAAKDLALAAEEYKAAKDAGNWLNVLGLMFDCALARRDREGAKDCLDMTRLVLDDLGGDQAGIARDARREYLAGRVAYAAVWDKPLLRGAAEAYLAGMAKTASPKDALAHIERLAKGLADERAAQLTIYQSAEKAYHGMKDRHPMVILNIKLAEQLLKMKRPAEAQTHLKAAMAEAERIGFKKAAQRAKGLLGKLTKK